MSSMTADQASGGPDLDPTLTARQRKIVRFIGGWVQEHGYSPSMREIGRAVGLTSTSSVEHQLAALQAKGLSPLDVVNAVGAQNLILPSGTTKIGSLEYDVNMNASPQTVAELNDLPIKSVGTNTIYIHDVAHVRDGFPPQTNIARVDGGRAVLLTVQKTGNASTLDIISGIKGLLPQIKSTIPADLNIRLLADQSLFVRGSIQGVVREAIIAANTMLEGSR